MDNDSYNIDRYNDEICRIDNVNSSRLETIGHSKGGHKIFRLIPLDRKNIRNDTGEAMELKNFLVFSEIWANRQMRYWAVIIYITVPKIAMERQI